MKRSKEIQNFAKHYRITLKRAKYLFETYGCKPAGYQPVLGWGSDAKTVKGEKFGYITGILYLAQGNLSGYEVCPYRSPGCTFACLGLEGRAKVYKTVTQARVAKTHRLFRDKDNFLASMLHDAFRLMRRCAKLGYTEDGIKILPCFRPNGTSDLPFLGYILAETFSEVQIYDYTKNPNPWIRAEKYSNYHITFSRSEINETECLEALNHGINVTVVFSTKRFPATYYGRPVVSGDDTDLRFKDPTDKQGYIIGLKSKGKSFEKDKSNPFIVIQ